MIDATAATLAFRNRLLTLAVATTGSTSLSATATGYARAAGSFLTDGFHPGMEFLAAGFSTAGNNGYRVVKGVTALALTTITACTAEAAGSGRSLTVGLPGLRVWENTELTPVGGRPFLEEAFVPGTSTLVAGPFQGGAVEETGLYVIRWYGLTKYGIAGIRKPVDAIRALFSPGTTLTVSGEFIRMRGDVAVSVSQIRPQDGGWSVCTITIPWRARTTNAVAA